MPIYTIVRRPDQSGYDIHVKDESGSRHTILGFKTEEEAKAWIEVDQSAVAEANCPQTKGSASG